MASEGAPVARRRTRLRWVIAGLVVIVLLLAAAFAHPAYHLLRAIAADKNEVRATPSGFADDFSRLDQTKVREVWPIPADTAQAEQQLAALLRRATTEKLSVSIAGARHSMGGHTIAPDGIVVDMRPFKAMSVDEPTRILHVQTGATWADVIGFLDPKGLSVQVMQSNNDFTIGGSLSVNCHGWQYGHPPIAATVESFRIMLASGEIRKCSRNENRELFSLALGGYGLLGVILDADLRVTMNVRLYREQESFSVDEGFTAFEETQRRHPKATMMFGRLNIVPDRFLQDVIVTAFSPLEGTPPPLADLQAPGLRRAVIRGSAGSDYGKWLRWTAETQLMPHVWKKEFSRNELLNAPANVYENRTDASTDILHEYFIPQAKVAQFLRDMRRIVPAHHGDLMNVTVRGVEEDRDAFLRYVDKPMIAFVMLFTYPRTPAGDDAMAAMTREMIDAALACDGRYYLPYRLHATQGQFERAYPMAKEFFAKKREYDPAGLFQNMFYKTYGVVPSAH